MTAIGDLLKNQRFGEHATVLEAQMREKEYNLRSYKCNVAMSYDEFRELIKMHCNDIMLKRSVWMEYLVDKQNEPVIRQIYLYFTNDPACKWNLNAGLLFAGKVGCGKTLLLTAFLRIANDFAKKQNTIIHSKAVASEIIKNGVAPLSRLPLMIDDLGREESEVRDFGNIVKPIIDLFSARYENGARTYATTNFNWERFETFYSEFIVTRMQEMMTIVHLPGESRRLKNEIKNTTI